MSNSPQSAAVAPARPKLQRQSGQGKAANPYGLASLWTQSDLVAQLTKQARMRAQAKKVDAGFLRADTVRAAVWGSRHALTAIGIAGQASVDKVAGPVGELLIMTAIGVAVAVPAVLG